MQIENRHEAAVQMMETEALAIRADGSQETKKRFLVEEHLLEIFVNGQKWMTLVCTPSDLAELVVGRMITEGVVHGVQEIEKLEISADGHCARILLAREISGRNSDLTQLTYDTCNQTPFLEQSGQECGQLAVVPLEKEWIFAMTAEFAAGSRIHKKTKGTHCCYLGIAGTVLYAAEDIGRHNALDKAIGHAAMRELDFGKCILFTTGRVPVDMARKVITAGMPVLVSKAVPTVSAVNMAREHNLNLICSAWPDEFEVYNRGVSNDGESQRSKS